MTNSMYVIRNNKTYDVWLGPCECSCGKQLDRNEQHQHPLTKPNKQIQNFLLCKQPTSKSQAWRESP